MPTRNNFLPQLALILSTAGLTILLSACRNLDGPAAKPTPAPADEYVESWETVSRETATELPKTPGQETAPPAAPPLTAPPVETDAGMKPPLSLSATPGNPAIATEPEVRPAGQRKLPPFRHITDKEFNESGTIPGTPP